MKTSYKIVKIIFNIKGRSKYLKSYLNLLEQEDYNKSICFDLLIINEKNNKIIKKQIDNLKIINVYSKKKISGMNTIFKEIFNLEKILIKYHYCCFVEDDNFIFPKSLMESKNFLENNKNFIACSGKSFIFSLNRDFEYFFLNKYISPNTNSLTNIKDRFKLFNGALCYYSLFRTNIFLKITKLINSIHDDNLSEVLFNFMTIKFGKINLLNNIYLARKYPRPKVYNIPDKTTWFKNMKLNKDIHFVMRSIDKNYSTLIFEDTIYKYLSNRLKKSNKSKTKDKFLYIVYKYSFYLFNFRMINNFIKNINRL